MLMVHLNHQRNHLNHHKPTIFEYIVTDLHNEIDIGSMLYDYVGRNPTIPITMFYWKISKYIET